MKANLTKFFSKNAKTILLGVGITGLVAAIPLAIKGKDNYDRIIKKTAEEKPEIDETTGEKEEITRTDMINAGVKAYWKSAVIAIFSITCLVASNKIGSNQVAIATAAYAAKKKECDTIVEKAKTKLGDKKWQEVEEEIAEEKMKKASVPTEIITAGNGDQLYYDSWYGRYFWSNSIKVEGGVNKANAEYLKEGCLSVNEFWEFVHPAFEEVKAGDYEGWDYNENNREIAINFFSKTIHEGPYAGRSAMVIQFARTSEPNLDLGTHK